MPCIRPCWGSFFESIDISYENRGFFFQLILTSGKDKSADENMVKMDTIKILKTKLELQRIDFMKPNLVQILGRWKGSQNNKRMDPYNAKTIPLHTSYTSGYPAGEELLSLLSLDPSRLLGRDLPGRPQRRSGED